MIPAELQYVEIIATTASSGTDNNVQEERSDSEDAELASTITVLATPEQARLLAELEQTGKLHAALVYRGGSENARKFLDEQGKVLEELYSVETEEKEESEAFRVKARIQTAHRHRLPVKQPTQAQKMKHRNKGGRSRWNRIKF